MIVWDPWIKKNDKHYSCIEGKRNIKEIHCNAQNELFVSLLWNIYSLCNEYVDKESRTTWKVFSKEYDKHCTAEKNIIGAPKMQNNFWFIISMLIHPILR